MADDKPEKPKESKEKPAEAAPPARLSIRELQQHAATYKRIEEKLRDMLEKSDPRHWPTLINQCTEQAGQVAMELVRKDAVGPWAELSGAFLAVWEKPVGSLFWCNDDPLLRPFPCAIKWIMKKRPTFFAGGVESALFMSQDKADKFNALPDNRSIIEYLCNRINAHIDACRAMEDIILEEVKRRAEAAPKKASWPRYACGFGLIAALTIGAFLLVNTYGEGSNFLQKMQNSSFILPYVGGAVVIIVGLFFGKDIFRKIWPLT